MATSGDLHLATSGDFYMATDTWPLRRDPNQAMNGRAWAGSWWPSSVR